MLKMRAKRDIHIGPRLDVAKGQAYAIDDACPEIGFDVLSWREGAFLYSATAEDIARDFERF